MSCKFLCTGTSGKNTKKSNMYSDSSSTTGSESEENFPGYIPVPMADSEEVITASYGPLHGGKQDKTKVYQPYKGQLKISAYVNYGLLTVHVIMGRHLRSKVKGTSDSYVKLSLTPDDTQRTRCKTEVIHDTNNPLYDEKFSFELLEEDTPKRLFITMWDRDPHRNQCEFLGCMSFGVRHIQSKQKTIHGWYYLLNADLGRKKHLQVTDRKHLSGRASHAIAPVNQDLLWMEPRVLSIKRGKSGFGFTINGSCPVTVCRVEAKSTAESSGVKVGDCIVRIDGLNVSRSTCDSVARIIKHAQKRILLEVQRPKKVDTGNFKLENLDRSPRQPLSSSTPFSENRIHDNQDNIGQWKPESRRMLSTVLEEESPPSPKKLGLETQDYGWIDNHHPNHYEGEEDIYVEPDEIRPEVLRIPQDPPALPPNHPTMGSSHLALASGKHRLVKSHSNSASRLESMVVSPWKPPSNRHHHQQHARPENDYMPLDGVRNYYQETDLDEGSEHRFEWDYSDTRLRHYHDDSSHHDSDDDNTLDHYGWIDSRWGPTPSRRNHKVPEREYGPPVGHERLQPPSNCSLKRCPEERLQAPSNGSLKRYGSSGGSSSGYSTLPRSMKLSNRSSRPPSCSELPHDRYRDSDIHCHGYRDDMAIRSTGAGAHGYQGDHCTSAAPTQRRYPDGGYHRDSSCSSLAPSQHRSHYMTGSSSGLSSHSSSTLPRRKKVSFKDFS